MQLLSRKSNLIMVAPHHSSLWAHPELTPEALAPQIGFLWLGSLANKNLNGENHPSCDSVLTVKASIMGLGRIGKFGHG